MFSNKSRTKKIEKSMADTGRSNTINQKSTIKTVFKIKRIFFFFDKCKFYRDEINHHIKKTRTKLHDSCS